MSSFNSKNNPMPESFIVKAKRAEDMDQIKSFIDGYKETNGIEYVKYGKDYTCAYKSNVSVGRAVVTVKGKGNYRGSQEVDFAIYPKGTSIVKLKAGKNSLKVKWLVQDKKMKKLVMPLSVQKLPYIRHPLIPKSA